MYKIILTFTKSQYKVLYEAERTNLLDRNCSWLFFLEIVDLRKKNGTHNISTVRRVSDHEIGTGDCAGVQTANAINIFTRIDSVKLIKLS